MNGTPKAFMRRRNVLLNLMLASILLMAVMAEGSKDDSATGKSTSGNFLQSLSEKERVWLHDHPVIRVVQDPGWPPVEFIDERGEPSGMSGDYLRLIEQRLGVTFEWVRNLSWQAAYERLKRREIDMTTSVAVTPEREGFWAFTMPYMKIPIVIATNPDVTYIADMRELAGKKIAVVDGYAVTDWIPRDFPEIRLLRVKTAQEGLEKLQRGEVFAYIDNLLIIGHYQAKMKVTNIKIAGQTPYVNAQSMAVRKDWAPLAGILDKALDSISEAERNEIYRKWLPIRYEHGFNYTLLWQVLAVFAVIFAGLLLWIRKLAGEIRHRKQAEAASDENARRFRRLFNVTVVPLCLVDKDGVLVDFNSRFVQTFGYTHEDVPTLQEWWQLAYPDPNYRRWVVEMWDTAVRRAVEEGGDIEPVEYEVTCKNGEVRVMVISGAVLGDDFLAAFFDVTERRAAESEQRQLFARAERSRRAMLSALEDQKRIAEDLRESEDRFRNIFEQGPMGIAMAGLTDGRFIGVNPALCEMLGYTEAELQQMTFTDITHPDHRDVDAEAVRQLREGKIQKHITEKRYLRKNGDVIWATRALTRFLSADKKTFYALAMIHDITERKQAEEELWRYRDDLEGLVGERTKELADANLRLQELDRLKSMFIASMSHELRTPLNSIIGFTGIILMGMSGEISTVQRKQLGMVKNSADHLLELINDVIDVSKIEAGKTELSIEEFDLSGLVIEVKESFTPTAAGKGLNLELQNDGAAIPVTSDRRRVKQILVNLIGNAVKFTKTGTVAIAIGEMEPGVQITVQDTGVGIERNDMERLFHAFSRIHITGRPVVEGTGLGLYLSRRLAALLRGEITAESEPGRGSVFTLSLPRAYQEDRE